MFNYGKSKDGSSKGLDPQVPTQMMESLKNLKKEMNNPPIQTAQNSRISSSSSSSRNTCVQSSSHLIQQPPATKEGIKIDPMEAAQNLLQNAAQVRNATGNSGGNDIAQTNQPLIQKPNCFKILKDIQLTHHKEPKEPFILENEEEDSEDVKERRMSRIRKCVQQRTRSAPSHSLFDSFMSKVKQVPNIIAGKITKIKNKNEIMNDSIDHKNKSEMPFIEKKQEKTSETPIISSKESSDLNELDKIKKTYQTPEFTPKQKGQAKLPEIKFDSLISKNDNDKNDSEFVYKCYGGADNKASKLSSIKKPNNQKMKEKKPINYIAKKINAPPKEFIRMRPLAYNKLPVHEDPLLEPVLEKYSKFQGTNQSKRYEKCATEINEITNNKYGVTKGSVRGVLQKYLSAKQNKMKQKKLEFVDEFQMDFESQNAPQISDSSAVPEPSETHKLLFPTLKKESMEMDQGLNESFLTNTSYEDKSAVSSTVPEKLSFQNPSLFNSLKTTASDAIKNKEAQAFAQKLIKFQNSCIETAKMAGSLLNELEGNKELFPDLLNNIRNFLPSIKENIDPKLPAAEYHDDNDIDLNNDNVYVQNTNGAIGNSDEKDKDGRLKVSYQIIENIRLKNSTVLAEVKGEFFTYTVSKSRGKKVHYHCNRCPRKAKDASKAHMINQIFYVELNHSINCKGPIPQNEQKLRKIKTQMRKDVLRNVKPIDAHNMAFKQAVMEKIQDELEEYIDVKKVLQRLHGKLLPSSIPGTIAQEHSKLLQGLDWLQYEDNGTAVFASEQALRIMASSKTLACDATFSTAPYGFSQTFYIHGLVKTEFGEEWNVLLMAPMVNKDQATYETIINVIKQKWAEYGIQPEFDRVHCDYENGLLNALQKLNGADKVYGCLFHFDQAFLRYIKSKGLYDHYMAGKKGKPEFDSIRRWFRLKLALPMLPANDAIFFWEHVLSKVPPVPVNVDPQHWPTKELKQIVAYMNRTWIPRLKAGNTFSFFNLNKRNTNVCEGYHSFLPMVIPKNPKYKVFLQIQQTMFSKTESRILKFLDGKIKPKPKNKKYAELQVRISSYEDHYSEAMEEASERNASDEELLEIQARHCSRISYLLHEVRNKSLMTMKSAKATATQQQADNAEDLFEDYEDYDFKKSKDLHKIIENAEKMVELEMNETFDEQASRTYEADIVGDEENNGVQKLLSESLNETIPFDWSAITEANALIDELTGEQRREDFLNFKAPEIQNKIKSETSNFNKRLLNSVQANESVEVVEDEVKLQPKIQQDMDKVDGINNLRVMASKNMLNSQKKDNQKLRPGGIIPNDDVNVYFNSPSKDQIIESLKRLGLDPSLVEESPLLTASNNVYNPLTFRKGKARGDGHCFFRSASVLLTGNQRHHWQIRLRTYDHIIKHGLTIHSIGSAKIVKEFERKRDEILKVLYKNEGVPLELWAGNDDAHGLSDLIGLNIWFRYPSNNGFIFAPHLTMTEDKVVKAHHLPVGSDYIPGEPLILPDKSILEEYVRRKRGELERLYSEPLRSPSHCGSPCLSTTSELVPACAVRIVEPRNRAIAAHISAPNRATADSIESHSLPTSNRNSKMIKLMTFPPNFDSTHNNNNNNNGIGFRAAAFRKPVQRREALTIQHFDTPKTPFEAAMQNQAAQMAKKSSVASNLSALSEGDAQDTSLAEPSPLEFQHRRRPSVESTQSMPPIASGNVGQSFAQAAALASQPRHERYAAHIPVRQTSMEPSGRQSTTSIDSTNSGVLDTASKQLDQMIDQARYRHHQHRSKFKEAIDYLDQIFEDLKKEVEPPTSISSEHKTEIPPPLSTKGIQAAKAVFQKPVAQPQPQQPTGALISSQTTTVPIVRLRKPSELALRQQQQNQQHSQQPKQPHLQSAAIVLQQPQPIIRNNGIAPGVNNNHPKISYPAPLRHPTASSKFQQPSTSANTTTTTTTTTIGGGPKPFPKIESADVEISETIVLPSKGNPEKMNFTRQWLAGDIKSWAEKPDLIVPSGDLTSPNDSDDRSIGSCSAEVAAINAFDRKKKRQIRETPDIIKSSKTTAQQQMQELQQKPQPKQQQAIVAPAPFRPQPFRPQPQYATFPINGGGNLPTEPTSLQKAPSHEYVMAIQRAHQERAGSQDYQSLGSVHSQDGYKPLSTLSLYSNSLNRSGAFQQYPQRGSIHSLPDASLTNIRPPLITQQPTSYQQDPILAIDALVAELELNTEPDRNGEKRRSFPTGQNYGPSMGPTTSSNRGLRQTAAATNMPRHGSLNIKHNSANNGGSMDRGLRRMQIQQRSSLDEMANMLTNVAGDLKPAKQQPFINGHPQNINQMATPKKFGLKISENSNNRLGFSPFETINQERIAPSRVGAMQQMFETKKQTSNGNENGWRKAAPPSKSTSKEEENYYEIQEYSQAKIIDRPSPMLNHRQLSSPMVLTPSRQQSFTGSHHSFPLPQPPSGPPPPVSSCVSSANSSQHGYYSSSTSSVGRANGNNGNYPRDAAPSSNGPQRQGSFAGKHSLSSRAPSFEEDIDDGFYDNILVDDRRFSEADNNSILSHQLPPTQKGTGRLGQLIRRIGGGSHRPPTNALSSMSLNKMGLDGIRHLSSPSSTHHPLMKSNSLSNEPWRAQIFEGDKRASHPGIGYRLKQTIFGGSKKRLN